MWTHRLILHLQAHILCLIRFFSLNLINPCTILLINRITSVLIINIHKQASLCNQTNGEAPIRRTRTFITKITIETLFCVIFSLEKCSISTDILFVSILRYMKKYANSQNIPHFTPTKWSHILFCFVLKLVLLDIVLLIFSLSH